MTLFCVTLHKISAEMYFWERDFHIIYFFALGFDAWSRRITHGIRMGTDKNLRIGIYAIDITLLTLFILGFYKLVAIISPASLNGIDNVPWLLFTYLLSFSISAFLFPSITQSRFVKGEAILLRVITTCFMTLLFISLITLLSHPSSHFPRKFLLISIGLYMIFLFIERFCIRAYLLHLRSNKRNQKRVLLIGCDQTVSQLFSILNTPLYGYDIIGTFYDGECPYENLASKRIGSIGDIYGWLTKNSNVNEIYGHFPKDQHYIVNMISKFCDNHLIRFYYIPTIDVFKGNMAFRILEGVPVIARREEPLRNVKNQFIKRTFDIIFSALVLILIFPWMFIIVAIIIKIQSPGPIFFLQERTGLDGKIFKCIKFRSMKVNDDADKVQATADDPRKFPFGDFMRKANIDELPQFINVFVGDMSVVGPRPHMLRHTNEYSKLINRFMVRHFAKPGITGLAQVTGFRGETRYIDQMEGRVKKDIEYIENWTFLLDIKIIFQTVWNMFGKEKGNAY